MEPEVIVEDGKRVFRLRLDHELQPKREALVLKPTIYSKQPRAKRTGFKVRPCWKCKQPISFRPTEAAPLGAWVNEDGEEHHRCPLTLQELLRKG